MKPTAPRWRIWSIPSFVIPSPHTGATAPPHRRTVNASGRAAKPRAPATSIRNTGLSRLGEIRDRSFEQQRYRASGLTLVTAAIALWNTVYLERAVNTLRDHGLAVHETMLRHLSPLGWEHINLTGDYLWRSRSMGKGKYRPLRPIPTA